MEVIISYRAYTGGNSPERLLSLEDGEVLFRLGRDSAPGRTSDARAERVREPGRAPPPRCAPASLRRRTKVRSRVPRTPRPRTGGTRRAAVFTADVDVTLRAPRVLDALKHASFLEWSADVDLRDEGGHG